MTRILGSNWRATSTVPSIECPSTNNASSTHGGICSKTWRRFSASFRVGITILMAGVFLLELNRLGEAFTPCDCVVDSSLATMTSWSKVFSTMMYYLSYAKHLRAISHVHHYIFNWLLCICRNTRTCSMPGPNTAFSAHSGRGVFSSILYFCPDLSVPELGIP